MTACSARKRRSNSPSTFTKTAKPQSLPVVPRLIFTLKQEEEIWRLTEVTARSPHAADRSGLSQGTAQGAGRSQRIGSANAATIAIAGEETATQPGIRTAAIRARLSTLFCADPDATLPERMEFRCYDPAQGNEESSGYRFALTGCDGNSGLQISPHRHAG